MMKRRTRTTLEKMGVEITDNVKTISRCIDIWTQGTHMLCGYIEFGVFND